MHWSCDVKPGEKQIDLSGIDIESIDSTVSLSLVGEKELFLVELWGGQIGRNEFHICDNKREAYESFKVFLEQCSNFAEEDECEEIRALLRETREELKL